MEDTREAAPTGTGLVEQPRIHEGPVEGFVPDEPTAYPVAKTFPAFLPSGAKWLLRRPNILALLQRGDIPNPLIGVVQQAFAEGELADKARDLARRADEAGRSADEQLEWERESGVVGEDEEADTAALVQDVLGSDSIGPDEALSYIDVIVYGSVVKPRLTFAEPIDPGGVVAANGELSMSAVDDTDKLFVFQWATAQLDGIARFREDGAGTDSQRDSGTLRPEAEQSAVAAVDA